MLNKLLLTLLISSLVFGAGLFSLAQEETPAEVIEAVNLDEDIEPEDLGVSEPNILPDSPFYFLKEWGRNIQSFFTFDPVKKVELIEKFANEKLIELKKVVEQEKTGELIERAVENYQNEVEKAEKFTERIREKAEENEEVGEFLDKFIQNQALHQRLLQKLENQVPTETLEKIEAVREIHLEKFGEVVTNLEENKEKIQERLEKNLKEVKGSEFKDFKSLEVLKELEEKVPEEAKEAIEKAKEGFFVNLKEKLEQIPVETQEIFREYTEKISGEKEKQMEILEELKEKIEAPALKEKVIQSKDKILEQIKLKEIKLELKTGEETEACITLWDPVCGADGKTYSNSCFAKVAGVEITYEGECKEQEQKKEMQKLESKTIESQIKLKLE
jgi:predicted phage tail protein